MPIDSPSATEIVPLDEGNIVEAAEVMARAFQSEPISSSILDLSTTRDVQVFARGNTPLLEWFRGRGQPVLLAIADDRVVGMAGVNAPDLRLRMPLRHLFTRVLPLVPCLAGFLKLVRWRQALRVRPLIRPPSDLPSDRYTLEVLAVAPEHQGQGIGRLLLNEVNRIADSSTWSRGVYLYTGSGKTRSLYERFGYEVLQTRTNGILTIYHMFRESPPNRQ